MAGVLSNQKVIQLGFLVRDVEATKKEWAQFLGTPVNGTVEAVDTRIAKTMYFGKPAPEVTMKATMYKLGEGLFMELMQPDENDSEWRDKLDRFGEGLHHIAFYVDDMEKEIASCESNGYPLIQNGVMLNESGTYAYVDTRRKLKTIVEMLCCYTPMEEGLKAFVDMDPKYRTSSVLGTNDIMQIAIACRDIEATAREWSKFLGAPLAEVSDAVDTATAKTEYMGKPSPTTKLKAAMYKIGEGVYLELMQPDGGDSVWWDYLDEHGEGVHHIAFAVKDMDKAQAECARIGYKVTQQGFMKDNGGRYAYIDSEKRMKITIELLEFNGDYVAIHEALIKK